MPSATLDSGDWIEFSIGGKTYKGTILEVIKATNNGYMLVLESNDPEFPFRIIQVEHRINRPLRV